MKVSKKSLLFVASLGAMVISGFACLLFFTDFLVEKDLLRNPPAKRCSDCHKKIFDEWMNSRHAAAWVSPAFKKESEEYKKEKCMGCHNPLVVSFDKKPDQRDFHLNDGVSCLACHFRENKMFGPFDLFAPPHPTQKNDGYRHSGFCQGCHTRTFKEWEETKVRTTCQKCHMAMKKGKMMDRFPFRLLHFSREIADHSWPALKADETNLNASFTLTGKEVRLSLKNTGIPHGIPTAQNGDPKLYVEILFFGKSNEELEKNKVIFAPQQDSSLQYNKQWNETYQIPEGSVRVELIVSLKRPWKKEKELLFKKRKEILPVL